MTLRPWEGSPREPRDWQRRALPILGDAWRAGERPVVRAVTGAGKAQLISEVCALMLKPDEVVVVTAPRQSLVEQLSGIEGGDELRPGSIAWRVGEDRVGVFYGRRKSMGDVIVTCNPSLPALVEVLGGRPCRALVVDECHRSESPAVLAAVDALNPRFRVGFSATPWRSEKSQALSLFSREVFTYGLADAIRDGVLVPWDTVGWDGRTEGNTNTVCVELIRQHGNGPGIVSAASIEDAESYAGLLTTEGIPALAVHSELRRADRQDRIARLLSGDLRCLVHVALLQEGVDIPELRWLCMRRPTATAIRFVQELGRVLRSHPGKDRALLMDPYDLEGAIGVVHDSKIGESLDAAVDSVGQERETDGGGDPPKTMAPPVAVSEVTRWARRSLLALIEAGIAAPMLKGRGWRGSPPSEKQVATLRRLRAPEARALEPQIGILNRGEVSDVLGLLFAIQGARRGGATLPELPAPPVNALRSLQVSR